MVSTVTLFHVKTLNVRKQQSKLEKNSLLTADKIQDFKGKDFQNFRNPSWYFKVRVIWLREYRDLKQITQT